MTWTPEKQRSVFSAAYLKARSVFPGMGGRFVDQFPQVVIATAEAQGEQPEALFRKHLATWLSRPLPRMALNAPYAFFAQAWGELADKGPVEAEKPRLDARATKEEREGKLADLRAAYGRQEALLGLARARGDRGVESSVLGRLEQLRVEMRALLKGGG